MVAQASMKHVRITPKKIRPVCNEIRGLNIGPALDFLSASKKKGADLLLKLLKSAIANAEHKGGVDVDNLYIKELLCDKGTVMKRWLPRARGMATPILKRSSHVKVVLDERT